jgi:hypothetical protein
MARKNVVDAYIDGGAAAIAKAPPLEHEYDSAEVQEEVLHPKTIDFETIDGTKFKLPLEFTIGQLRQKVQNKYYSFQQIFFAELGKVFGTGTIDWQSPAITGVLFKDSVEASMYEMLAAIFNTAKSTFENKLNQTGAINVLTWAVEMINLSRKAAENQDNDDDGELTDPKK